MSAGGGAFGPRLVPSPLADDAAARERIRTSLRESLIVEASAGTGKTTELVRRIVAVLGEGAAIDQIAAVTFTNKAAGELKLRLRQELDRARGVEEDARRAANLEGALAHLEEASIGTIHAFCGQLLRERPVEALVDPAFREITELEGQQIYNRAFRGWVQQQLNQTSPGLRRALVRLAWGKSEAPPLERLKSAGRQLIEWRDYPAKWERVAWDREAEIDRMADLIRQTAPKVNQKFQAIADLANWIDRSESVRRTRDYDTLESLLLKLLNDLAAAKRKGAEELMFVLENFRTQADADLAHELRDEMATLVDRYEDLKRQSGLLDFQDLLIKARDLVRSNREVRQYLQGRYSNIFVDEFQDTDPVQAELILLLSSDDPNVTDWLATRPAPGKLFLVGDPKQSIYRFRRADVVLYRQLRDRLSERGTGIVRLTRSFRSLRPLQQFVNAAFASEMKGDEESGQADYSPLEERRPGRADQPAVVALPVPRPYGTRNISRWAISECLPDATAAYIDWLLRESGWTVEEPETGRQVPIAARHVCILYRRFTNFGQDITRDYTRSLEARGIPHLLVGSKSFHAREEVETLRAALAAVEWPGDELSVFAALKGALFAIPDATLLKFRHAHQRLSPFLPDLDSAAPEFESIRAALTQLADLHRQRNWRSVAETVARLLEFTRSHAGFALRPGGQQALANVYRLADLARGYETEGGISFRGFVDMLEAQVERAESSEAPVLEEGSDGVRLMTVHAAKGLEFPVVVLADIAANLASQKPDRYVNTEAQLCAMRLLNCTPWPLLEHQEREHGRDLAEGVRVAYVAATRARDLLVVPAVGDEELDCWLGPLWKAIYPARGTFRRSEPAAPGCPRFGDSTVLNRPMEYDRGGEMSVRPGLVTPFEGTHRVVWWDPRALRLNVEANFGFRQEEILAPGAGSAGSLAAFEAWGRERTAVSERGRVPAFDIFTPSETTEPPPDAPNLVIGVAEIARPPSRPFGPRFGSLIHAVLRDVAWDATRDAIDAHVDLQGRVFGAGEEECEAAAEAVASALQHPLLAAARSAPRVHREWPLAFRAASGRLLEGIVDLAYFDGKSWQIVDYKTDSDFVSRRKHYETQLRWYVHAAGHLTNQPVRGWLLRI